MQLTDFLIVEDEVLIAESISEILKKAGYRKIRIASSVEEALEMVEKTRPEMVLTDINLGRKKTGIDLGNILLKQYKIPFIYVTSHSSPDILSQAKHTRPNAYIIKPFKNQDLLVAIELALFNSNNKYENNADEEGLVVKEGRALVKLSYNNIMWLEADGNYTTINISNGKRRVIRESITDFEAQLGKQRFIRIHKSYLVNCAYITETRANTVCIDDHELPIGRTYQSSVASYFNC